MRELLKEEFKSVSGGSLILSIPGGAMGAARQYLKDEHAKKVTITQTEDGYTMTWPRN